MRIVVTGGFSVVVSPSIALKATIIPSLFVAVTESHVTTACSASGYPALSRSDRTSLTLINTLSCGFLNSSGPCPNPRSYARSFPFADDNNSAKCKAT